MGYRLVDIFVPKDQDTTIEEILSEHETFGIWHEELADQREHVQVLLREEEVEPVLDLLERRFAGIEDFRAILIAVEASIPRIKETEEENEQSAEPTKPASPKRIHREELYSAITERTKLNWIYLTLVILSAIVAVVGLTRDNVAIIIGAMVIAPLLGPNVALSLGTTLYDRELIMQSLKANAAGVLTAFGFAFLMGLVFDLDFQVREIQSRMSVGLGDVALALASGVAGVLAFTTKTPASLVGVMVAVALMPPLVVCGMLLGAGEFQRAFGALLLLSTNVICINLAGVLTFLAQGVGPRTWWEKGAAKRSTQIALIIWGLLLVFLIGIIYISQALAWLP